MAGAYGNPRVVFAPGAPQTLSTRVCPSRVATPLSQDHLSQGSLQFNAPSRGKQLLGTFSCPARYRGANVADRGTLVRDMQAAERGESSVPHRGGELAVGDPKVEPETLAIKLKNGVTVYVVRSAGRGKDGVDQDAYFYGEFGEFGEFVWYGVCDGHGKRGKEASQLIATQFNVEFKLKLSAMSQTETGSLEARQAQIKSVFQDTFASVDKEVMQKYPESGSTLAVALSYRGAVFFASVGDSRGIIIKDGVVTELSDDQTPERPDELRRLNKGYLKSNPTEPFFRLWSRKPDDRNWSTAIGYMMSRSIGDKEGKDAKNGMNAAPEVSYWPCVSKDGGSADLIIASDGVWERVSYTEILAQQDPDCGKFAKNVHNVALKAWDKAKFRDDITVVLVKVELQKGKEDGDRVDLEERAKRYDRSLGELRRPSKVAKIM